MGARKNLKVLDIYLDTDNPRHEPIDQQPDIIKCLLKDEKVKNLARHISEHGMNPLESIGVKKDTKGNYIVKEGNRRLCALHLLNDPSKAPKNEIKYFKKLSEKSKVIPNNIDCVLFDDEDEASLWMGVRHNGEQDGIGTRNWDSTQRTRHNNRINKKDSNALASSLIDYAVHKKFLAENESKNIITTASRYLGNPTFRQTIGILSPRSESNVQVNVPFDEFDKCLEKFFQDLVKGEDVNSRSKKADWVEYANKLNSKGIAPKSKVLPQLLSDGLLVKSDEDEFSASTSNLNKEQNLDNQKALLGRSNKNPDSRKYVIPSDFRVSIENKILSRVFNEMKSIEVDDHPLAVSLLLRAFLENVYQLYQEHVEGNYTQEQTHIRMKKIIEQINKEKATLSKDQQNALRALRRIQGDENHALSPKTLGANAHGGIYPDAKQLKREFDNIASIIKYMLDSLKTQK